MKQIAALEQHRNRLKGLAYRMTGSASEAEDIVQDAFMQWLRTAPQDVANLEAWLVTVTSRKCLDYLKRKNARNTFNY